MIVYCVMGDYDYEGSSLLLVTADEEAAKALVEVERKAYDAVRIEKWDAATGQCDQGYNYIRHRR
jgi:hypothetical protein